MGIRLGKIETWAMRQLLGKKRGDDVRARLEQAVSVDPDAWAQVLDLADTHGVRGLLEKVQAAKEAAR